jgi:O-antigen ligase
MAWGFFFGITAHALWAMIALKFLNDVSLWGPKTAYLGFATGTFVNRNSFATFLGMGFILGLALALDRARNAKAKSPTNHLETGLVWVCLAIIAIALVSTQSRMGFLSTALGVVVVIFNLKPKRNLVLGIFFLGVLTLFFTGNLAQRSFLLLSDGSGRWELWRQSLAIVQVRPLIGFGLDAFAPVFALHHQPPLASDVIWEYAHNTYLSLWIECGIIFGSLPPAICAYIGLKLHRERKPLSPLPIAALAILCQNAMHSLVDFSLEMQANVFLLVAILALGLSAAMRGAESGIPYRKIKKY